MNFYQINRSSKPAFIDKNEKTITYENLANQIEMFCERFSSGRGILLLECDGHLRQYIAYLAALKKGIPISLIGEAERAGLAKSFSVKYHYRPKLDELSTNVLSDIEIHPELAVLLSTSGSTGAAKSVKLSKENLQANAESIVQYLEITSNDRAPLTLPFHYSYGMSVVNSYLLAGGSLVLVEGSVLDPSFWKTFQATKCTSFSGVPHNFELMERAGTETAQLNELRYMTQAGGKLAPEKIAAWSERSKTEGWRFFVMYGQTEASPRIAYLPPELAIDHPSCIGISIPNGELTIVNSDGEKVADETEGEVAYRGPNVMMGYALTNADLATGQGDDLLLTGDLGVRHQNGLFEIVGRKSRFVKPFGLRISLDEVEKRVQTLGYDAVCASEGDTLVVLIQSGKINDKNIDLSSIVDDLEGWLSIPKSAFIVTQVNHIPRLASGKVDGPAVRGLLSEISAMIPRRVLASDEHQSPLTRLKKAVRFGENNDLRSIFAQHFPGKHIGSHNSFTDLGGDSLSYISMAIDIERVIGEAPPNWQNMPLSDLEGVVRKHRSLSRIDTPTLLRGLSILFIVMSHLGLFQYGGGGNYILFVIAGLNFSALTIPLVCARKSINPIIVLLARIAVLTIGFATLTYAITGYGSLTAVLLISNWFDPNTPGNFWYVEVYLQITLLIAALAAVPWIRQWYEKDKMKASLIAGFVSITLMASSEVVFDLNHLYRRLPHLLIWLFAIGMAIEAANTFKDRLAVSALLIVGSLIFKFDYIYYYVSIGVLIWLPVVSIPRFLSTAIRQIASASLFIYLTHYQFAKVTERIFGPFPLINVLFAIVGGCIAWRLYRPIDNWVAARFSR